MTSQPGLGTGNPLYAATIGTSDIARSIDFYTRVMGFDVVDRAKLGGPPLARHWHVPAGAQLDVAVLADRWEFGRIVLLHWIDWAGRPIRHVGGQRCFGLINLNFYTNDIEQQTRRIAAAGCRPWTDPIEHDMGHDIGEPIEVMIDGPDTVILNLLQLQARNLNARVMETANYVRSTLGFNARGLTPVVTTQHCVRDADRGIAFYRSVVGMEVRIDTILKGELMEKFMGYPPGAMTRDVYVNGNSIIGKIAVNQPLNFACSDLVPNAVPPNYGYLAQSFIVDDLATALAHATRIGSQVYSPPTEIELPALRHCVSAIVRNPGSGALQELIQVA
jgi:predicted enzyme related to lactoylglutathione lyase